MAGEILDPESLKTPPTPKISGQLRAIPRKSTATGKVSECEGESGVATPDIREDPSFVQRGSTCSSIGGERVYPLQGMKGLRGTDQNEQLAYPACPGGHQGAFKGKGGTAVFLVCTDFICWVWSHG